MEYGGVSSGVPFPGQRVQLLVWGLAPSSTFSSFLIVSLICPLAGGGYEKGLNFKILKIGFYSKSATSSETKRKTYIKVILYFA